MSIYLAVCFHGDNTAFDPKLLAYDRLGHSLYYCISIDFRFSVGFCFCIYDRTSFGFCFYIRSVQKGRCLPLIIRMNML